MIRRSFAAHLRDAESAHVRKLEAALSDIANQTLSSEMPAEERQHADWQGGYDRAVCRARAAMERKPE
jgi:hypothetical protein